MGNHERSIQKRHETGLTERLVEKVRKGGNARLGGYSGWVVFKIKHCQTRYRHVKMHYHHGFGGGGPVTRGVIQTNRQAVYLADADLVWTGHTHDSWKVDIARIRLGCNLDRVEHVMQTHFRTPGYKEEYGDGYGGWHIERGGPPKPVGAAWLRFRNMPGKVIEWDISEAR